MFYYLSFRRSLLLATALSSTMFCAPFADAQNVALAENTDHTNSAKNSKPVAWRAMQVAAIRDEGETDGAAVTAKENYEPDQSDDDYSLRRVKSLRPKRNAAIMVMVPTPAKPTVRENFRLYREGASNVIQITPPPLVKHDTNESTNVPIGRFVKNSNFSGARLWKSGYVDELTYSSDQYSRPAHAAVPAVPVLYARTQNLTDLQFQESSLHEPNLNGSIANRDLMSRDARIDVSSDALTEGSSSVAHDEGYVQPLKLARANPVVVETTAMQPAENMAKPDVEENYRQTAANNAWVKQHDTRVYSLRRRGYGASRQKFEAARSKASDEFKWYVPSRSVITPVIAVGTGYDSNPDEVFNNIKGSSYYMVDGAALANFGNVDIGASVLVRGSFSQYQDISENERWDFGLLADMHFTVDEYSRLNLGTFYTEDTYGVAMIDERAAFFEYLRSTDNYELFSKGRYYVIRHEQGDRVDELGLVTASGTDPSFDYQRVETKNGIRLRKNQLLSPYIQGGIADIEFLSPDTSVDIDRDATELFAVAGVRLAVSQQLFLDLGGRYNYRNPDDAKRSAFDNFAVDAKLSWTPFWTDEHQMYATVEMERMFKEAYTPLSYASDVTSYVLQTEYRQKGGLNVVVRAAYEENEQIGDDGVFIEKSLDGEFSYPIWGNMHVFLHGYYADVEEETSGDSYDRFKITGGIKIGKDFETRIPKGSL